MAETIPLSSNFSFTPGTILEDGALNANGLVVRVEICPAVCSIAGKPYTIMQ